MSNRSYNKAHYPRSFKINFCYQSKIRQAQTDAAIFLKTRVDEALVPCSVLPPSDIDHISGLGLVVRAPKNRLQLLRPSQITAEHSHLLTNI